METPSFQVVNKLRFSGHWICGAQDMGKTNALIHLCAQDLQTDASVIILDSKGEFTAAVRNLALGDRLIVLDPSEPFGINPLDVPKTDIKRAVNQVEYIFGALLDSDVSSMQGGMLRAIIRACITSIPNPTLLTVQEIVNDGITPYKQYLNSMSPDLQRFFREEWETYDLSRKALQWRLRRLIEEDPLVQQIFASPRSRFDIGQAMDEGKVVVIDNAQAKVHEDGCAFLGKYFVSRIWAAATARALRSDHEKRPVYVYIDEAHKVVKDDQKIADIIDECRSQKIGLIVAHQRAKQITDANVLSALENCAIKMANVKAEAGYFSRIMGIPVERMESLPQGHFACEMGREEPRIIKFPKAHLPFRQMNPYEQAAFKQRMKDLYGAEPAPPPEQPPPSPQRSSGKPQPHKPQQQKRKRWAKK